MGLEALKGILDNKLVFLNQELENEQKQIDSIEQFQEIIRVIKENPYILFTDEGEKYIKLLDLGEYNFPVLKKIYDGYVIFGRDAIPQISLVEDVMERIHNNLEQKVCFLSDLVVGHQANIIVYDGYKTLGSQIFNDDVYVTQIDTLRSLLDGANLSIADKNNILRSVIKKNNSIYKKRILEVSEGENLGEVKEVSEYTKNIAVLRSDLENIFGSDSLKFLSVVSELFGECNNVSEFDEILKGWDYSLGNSYSEIVDGIIKLKSIELLEYRDAFGESSEEVNKEIQVIEAQIKVLCDYKDSITLEREADEVDVSVHQNEYERVINEYNSDLSSYPNHVLFLSNAVGRDIDSIRDPETLRDVFLLLEKLKNDDVQSISKSFAFGGIRELKLSKKGHQARVRYASLGNNVYVISQILEKKADKYTGEENTLKRRGKEVSVLEEKVKKNPVVLDELVDITKVHFDKLFSLVSKGATNKIGGAF
jgi:hypothetical protein